MENNMRSMVWMVWSKTTKASWVSEMNTNDRWVRFRPNTERIIKLKDSRLNNYVDSLFKSLKLIPSTSEKSMLIISWILTFPFQTFELDRKDKRIVEKYQMNSFVFSTLKLSGGGLKLVFVTMLSTKGEKLSLGSLSQKRGHYIAFMSCSQGSTFHGEEI